MEQNNQTNKRLKMLVPLVIITVGFLVSAGLYATLIYTNCNSSGAMALLGDFRDFHSQAGC